MRILVVGSGGREHALTWKLAQEADVFSAPGNPGIASLCECFPVLPDDFAGIVRVAKELAVDLVLVGPEAPLVGGLADHLRAEDICVFGPGINGAQLEASKAFSKQLMVEASVPTAQYKSFSDHAQAREYCIERFGSGFPQVVKASGNALGKGVIVATSLEEALEAIDAMMVDNEFGGAGETIVLEDRLDGREFSLLTMCSGTSYISLPIAQDYKRALDGNRGPNTGGMGSVAPADWVTPDLLEQTEHQVVAPILSKLASTGIDYRGVLFSGVMAQDNQPYCIEYNVRFGDPETQSIMRLLGPGFADLLYAAAAGEPLPKAGATSVAPRRQTFAATVVMASEGYPGAYAKNKPITIPAQIDPEVVVFHAGTAMNGDRLVTNGGRVLGVSAIGNSLKVALERSYGAAQSISFEGAFFRQDIGF